MSSLDSTINNPLYKEEEGEGGGDKNIYEIECHQISVLVSPSAAIWKRGWILKHVLEVAPPSIREFQRVSSQIITYVPT